MLLVERKKIQLALFILFYFFRTRILKYVCVCVLSYRIKKNYTLFLAHFQRRSLSLGTQVFHFHASFPSQNELLSNTHFSHKKPDIGSRMRSQNCFLLCHHHHLPLTPLHQVQRIQILHSPSYISLSRPRMLPSFITSSVRVSSNPLFRKKKET